MTTHGAIYTRISADRNGDGLGVDRQLKACRKVAREHKVRVVETYRDNDTSAFNGAHRPGFEALRTDLEAGRIDVVIAWSQDRLVRRNRERVDLIDLLQATSSKVLTVTGGDLDPTTAEGRLRLGIIGEISEYESAHRSERVLAKMDEVAAAGRPHGGSRPYGFKKDRVTHEPAEARVIRDMVRRVVAREPVTSIVRDLNTRGVTSATGARWSSTAVRGIVTSARIAGLRTHRGQVIGEATWRPIVDQETWRAACAILADPSRRTNRVARKYVLSGIVRCSKCEQRMIAHPRQSRKGGPKVRTYACSSSQGRSWVGCGRTVIVAEQVEELVVDAVLDAAKSPAVRRAMGRADDGIGDDAVAIEAQMSELAAMWAAGDITRAEWMDARRGLERRLADLAASEASSYRARADAARLADVAARWPDLTVDERRTIIRSMVDAVVILPPTRPGRGFDRDRVRIDWRA